MNQHQIRTTVYLDESLYLAAKRKALEERTTMTELIQNGLNKQINDTGIKRIKKRRLLIGSYNLGIKKPYQKLRREDIYEDPKF